jgi:hypothetical protein
MMSNEKQFSQGFTPNLPLWSFQLQKDSKLALKTRKDLEIHLITRALKDGSFRAELIANPKAVIEQEIGSKLPDELEITVLEETADTVYMVLPCNPYEGVSEEELQANLGMTYEDVAQWVIEQQRSTFLDEESMINIMVRAWSNEEFKQELFDNSIKVVETELEEKIAESINIKVFTETAQNFYIVMPDMLEKFDPLNAKTNLLSDVNMLIIANGGSGFNTNTNNGQLILGSILCG